KIVLISRIQEQLGVLCLRHNFTRGIDVALAHENRVSVHAVNLHRYVLRPRSEGPLAADRQTGIEKQSPASASARLCQLLGGKHAEREARIDEFGGQSIGDANALLPEIIESRLFDIGEALFE